MHKYCILKNEEMHILTNTNFEEMYRLSYKYFEEMHIIY